jgi:hypothetical protein
MHYLYFCFVINTIPLRIIGIVTGNNTGTVKVINTQIEIKTPAKKICPFFEKLKIIMNKMERKISKNIR